MTNEEAIKVLLDEWKCIDRNDGINCDRKCESCDLVMDSFVLKDAYNMAIKALEQTTWIPCSEQLPKKNGRYLCTVGTDYRNPREMYYEPKGKNNRTWASLDRAYVEDCFIIAWMPLPKPYKVESEDKE